MNLDLARSLAVQLLAALEPDPLPPVVPPISTLADFSSALVRGDEHIVLSPAFVSPSALLLTRAVRIEAQATPDGRMDAAWPMPQFLGGITITGDDVTLVGVEVQHPNPLKDIIAVTGANCLLDRCRVLGDPAHGAKRGIAGNGAHLAIRGCYVDDCFATYPGDDSQAILIWDTPGPVLIEDCFLRAGSETVMCGGADPSSEANIPSDITIRNSTLTARPEWQALAIGVKSRLEFKNARRVLVEGCEISQCWGGHGQDGYLLSFTVRNQGGTAPYSTVEDVIIRSNTFAHGAACVNILATDNLHPSQRVSRIALSNNLFTDIDPKAYTGSNKMIQIGAGPVDVLLDLNLFKGTNIGSQIYFYGGAMCERLTVTHNAFPTSKYGVFGDNATVNKGWAKYVASGTFEGNVTG